MYELKVICIILLVLCVWNVVLFVNLFRMYSKCFDLEFEINGIKEELKSK